MHIPTIDRFVEFYFEFAQFNGDEIFRKDASARKSDRKIGGFLAHFWSHDFGTELCVK